MARSEIPFDYRRAFLEVLSKHRYPRFRPTRYPLTTTPGLISTFWPKYPPRHKIEAHCSTIHVDSALALLYARRDLRWVCNLEVTFHNTSSIALKFFQQSSEAALITVTQGTANKLKGDVRYTRILKVQSGILRWTSPEKSRVRDMRALKLVHIDHPTDILAVKDFQQFLAARDGSGWRGVEFEVTPPSSDIPENRDVYKPGVFSLTNSFMDLWTLKGRRPSIIPGWVSVERRYLFGNERLCSLLDGNGASLVLFIQDYLAQCFENLHEIRQSFWKDYRQMGGEEYMKAGGRYLGVVG